MTAFSLALSLSLHSSLWSPRVRERLVSFFGEVHCIHFNITFTFCHSPTLKLPIVFVSWLLHFHLHVSNICLSLFLSLACAMLSFAERRVCWSRLSPILIMHPLLSSPLPSFIHCLLTCLCRECDTWKDDWTVNFPLSPSLRKQLKWLDIICTCSACFCFFSASKSGSFDFNFIFRTNWYIHLSDFHFLYLLKLLLLIYIIIFTLFLLCKCTLSSAAGKDVRSLVKLAPHLTHTN